MAASERTAKQRLNYVRSLLAQASRNRECDRMIQADEAYRRAERELAAYTTLYGRTDDQNAELRYIIEAERLLVSAMLYAHSRPAHEVEASFEAALAATEALPAHFRGRVECCWGAVLLFTKRCKEAIERLERARKIFDEEHQRDEQVQTTYHLARALVQCGRRDEAITALRSVMPVSDHVKVATRYDLAAIILLATLLYFAGRRPEARNWHRQAMQRARSNNLYQTVEYDHLLIIRRFGFFVYAIFPGKRTWPEI